MTQDKLVSKVCENCGGKRLMHIEGKSDIWYCIDCYHQQGKDVQHSKEK